MQASYVNGFPHRMAHAIAALFERDGYQAHERKARRVWDVQNERALLPLTAGIGGVYRAADRASRECYAEVSRLQCVQASLWAIHRICGEWGVPRPVGETGGEQIARAVDRGWWLRQLRKMHVRRIENTSIKFGTTGPRTSPYIGEDAALWQRAQNAANARLLENTEIKNENGDRYTLAQLAATGVGNKGNRRRELMTRIRGFEEIAQELGHVALFWTITCPSKFHSVGGENPKYQDFTPRQAQAYLCKVWQRIRSAFQKRGIKPYGFRIAEPHTDGCPHWHMLFFVEPAQEPVMNAIIKKYALAEDAGEWRDEENRAKLVRIESNRGSAAGYIIKYVCKNVDGYGVGQHKAFEVDANGDRSTYNIERDMLGQEELTPSQRVTYWAQVHGIRQFQQIGGAPVGVWREIRRIPQEAVTSAPAEMQAAWQAAQKVRSDNPENVVQASWADYLKAQGGPVVGRKGAIQLKTDIVAIEGRYATYDAKKPVGVYAVSEAETGAFYRSIRYTWTRIEGGAVGVARTGVNNCTDFDFKGIGEKLETSTKALAEAVKNKNLAPPALICWPEIVRQARENERATKQFIESEKWQKKYAGC